MNGITVEQLFVLCHEQIKKGNGKKTVLISTDDEGNGYHTLYYSFQDNTEEIRTIAEVCYIHDQIDLNSIVMLG